MNPASHSRRNLAICIALLIASTLLTYWPVLKNEFINYDDPDYVTTNEVVKQGLTAEGFKWAFTTGHASNWHPITWLSHMADVSMFGMKPAGHHATNLVFHTANTVLLLLLLWLMTGSVWRSAMVAALFALHPLHVESVAWVAERKDMLSAFFGLLTLMAYTHYVAASKVSGLKAKVWYVAALGLFALGLMSKPMLVTWPFVMMLLDVWPLNRLKMEDRKKILSALIEKIPFLALTVVSCFLTFTAQSKGDAVASFQTQPLLNRCANAITAYAQYVIKFFFPADLSPIYPLESVVDTRWLSASVILLFGISIFVWRHRWQSLCPLIGWLWFLGTLVPVIGLVQVGSQAYADRYTYIPLIGLAMATVWASARLAERWRFPKPLVGGVAVIILAALCWRTSGQIPVWNNTGTLFETVLKRHPDNFQALYGLGGHLADTGRVDEAVRMLERALVVAPDSPDVLGKLADIYEGKNKPENALRLYRAGLAKQPDHPILLNNLAWLLATCPDSILRDGTEAVRSATRACELTRYAKPIFIGTLGAAKAEAGDFTGAIAEAERAAALADAMGLREVAARNRELKQLYQVGKGAHGGTPTNIH
jgi:hypothetical protein